MKHSIRRIVHGALAFLLVTASSTGTADDTEIYFSSGTSSGNTGNPVLPNVLFILDTSGSMEDIVPNTGNKSRMQVLKEAMTDIINNVEDINLGLMRFTNDDGGAVLFPISYIDAPVDTVVGEASDDPTYIASIITGADDAEENVGTQAVVLTDSTLDIAGLQLYATGTGTWDVRVGSSNDDVEEASNNGNMKRGDSRLDLDKSTHVGLRFTSIPIPQAATITQAFIEFKSDANTGSTPDADIFIQNVDNPSSFGSAKRDLTSRSFLSTNVEWDSIPTGSGGTTITTPNLKTLVQSIVDRTGWNSGQAMVFMFKEEDNSNKSADWRSYDYGSTTNRPRFYGQYEYSVPAGTSEQITALRFQSINIPQGVTVKSANLILTPQSNASGTSEWTIQAEASGDSPALAATAGNLSSRTRTTASATWSVPTLTENSPVASVDLSEVLQEIVDRDDWCGGNAITLIITGTGSRQIKAYEQGSSEAPKLQYSYENSDTRGCFRGTQTAQAGTTNDDTEETISNGDISRNSSTLNFQSGNLVGLRFRNLDVPAGAKILSANVRFRAIESDNGTTTVIISGENVGDAPVLTSTNKDLSNRSSTTATVTWTETTNWVKNSYYTSADISPVIEEIVGRGDWSPGNNVVLFFNTTTANDRRAYSYDGNANSGPYLTVTYKAEGGTDDYKTVRHRLIELVNELPSEDYTPIVESLLEAARYWRGDSVGYGLTRDNNRYARISHPGTYCSQDEDGNIDCHGATVTGSYAPYGINNPSGCDPTTNASSSNCAGQKIQGSPKYISPFSTELSCASNYQVLLTDGEANSLNSSGQTAAQNLVGKSSCFSKNGANQNYDSHELCGVDIAQYLFEEDQISDSILANEQIVKTYTIAFNLNDSGAVQFLKDMAKYGTGGSNDAFYSATSASDLISVFNTILTDVKKDPTSFVAPSLATNAFNRLLSRDEVYFGLFTPALERHWFGNVKKYNICIDSVGDPEDDSDDCTLGEILDATYEPAVDPADNKFKTTATSVWSDVIDGQATTRGGAGGELTDYTKRIIYTDATSSGTAPASGTALSTAGHKIDIDTWDDPELSHVRNAVCPTPSTSPSSDCATRMMWLLGKATTPDSENDASDTTRWAFNDVLHSSPVVITYGGQDTNDDGVIDHFFDRIVVGTNEGGIRFLNGTTGKEEWTFIPQVLLDPQQKMLFDNAEGDHLYGMDVTPTVHFRDVNGDGTITPSEGDFVHVIVAMRQGGKYVYALDVTGVVDDDTDTVVPKFLWRIQGGTGDFTRLGQTWSQPRLAKIYVTVSGTLTQREVLIFGGGYDPNLDNTFGYVADDGDDNNDPNHLGNAIYIVDANTGARILSISGDGSGADIEVEAMHYPIPSRITVLDSDGDGVDDRLYVGDLGGQVWRVDLAADVKATGSGRAGSSVVGRLAAISSTGSGGINERRFFEPPSVVQVKDSEYSDAAGGEYDYILIGTGWRQHPLDKKVHDRFYAFRDEVIGPMNDASPGDNLADSYPADTSGNAPISNADLIDITTRILNVDDTDIDDIKASQGWYYDFTTAGNDGEKVLSAPITIAGTVFFTTYQPDAVTNAEACSAQIGGGNAYNFSVLRAAATIDWDLDGSIDPLEDRALRLGGGIPSDVVPVFTKEGVVGIVGIEGGAAQLGTLSGLPRFRTYWYEESGL